MSSLSTVFNSIKQTMETDWSDLVAIFSGPKGSGFTQANFAKLIADFQSGLVTDTNDFLTLVTAVGVWGQQVAPLAQQIVNDAALVAAVQPAVSPIVAAMQATLVATQALDTILVGANTSPTTLSGAITILTNLEHQTGTWFTSAVAAIKATL